jgi:hypothetical protein
MIINSKCKLFHTGNIQYAENVFLWYILYNKIANKINLMPMSHTKINRI